MSIVSPFIQNTQINAYQGIPWDDSYKEIRLFNTQAERQSFLSQHLVQSWTACSIVKNGQSIKVTGQINDLLKINYLSFINYGAGLVGNERTFYAFVTSVNYVNINTVEIEYSIDWIQSYLFDFEIGECFVEREHVSNDTMGLHTLPENIDTGEMIISATNNWVSNPAIMAQIYSDNTIVAVVDNMVHCTIQTGYTLDQLSVLVDLLQTYDDSPERVCQLVMITEEMTKNGYALQKFSNSKEFVRQPFVFSFNGRSYTPKNNKLGCYPYMLFTVDNFDGQVEQYHYEDFDTSASGGNLYNFTVEGMPSPKPCMECIPRNYKNNAACPQESVKFDNFPEVPWLTDTYKAWVSQYGLSNVVSQGASLLSSSLQIGANVAGGNYGGAIRGVLGLVQNGNNAYQEYKDHKLHNRQMQGSPGSSGLNYSRGWIGFRVTQFQIKPEIAEKIDLRFTRYGYRVDVPKVPNIRGRQYLNYVKCNTAQVGGNIPVDTKNALEQALNSGVTFWHTDQMDMTVTSNPIV